MTAALLVTPAELRGERLSVAGDAYRHLFRARRLATGDAVRVVDGAGGARQAVVERVERGSALLRLGEAAPTNDPTRQVELLVAAPRPERAAWLVEKATELGVAAVRFLATERAVRGVDARSLDRLRRVAAAALEQCQGARLPVLSGLHDAGELPGLLAAVDTAVVLDPRSRHPLAAAVGTGSVALLLGPEGGWEEGELAALEAAGALSRRLGERVLRVETAAIAAAALWLLAD